MKTLDEVIDYCEGKQTCGEWVGIADALHYLREYRSDMKLWESDRKGFEAWIEQYKEARDKHQQAVIDMAKNPPLSWDELKAMEGKPVWVEINGYNGYWTIVHMNSNIVFEEYYDWIASPEDPMKAPLVSLDDTNFGTTWQAYRKER